MGVQWVNKTDGHLSFTPCILSELVSNIPNAQMFHLGVNESLKKKATAKRPNSSDHIYLLILCVSFKYFALSHKVTVRME